MRGATAIVAGLVCLNSGRRCHRWLLIRRRRHCSGRLERPKASRGSGVMCHCERNRICIALHRSVLAAWFGILATGERGTAQMLKSWIEVISAVKISAPLHHAMRCSAVRNDEKVAVARFADVEECIRGGRGMRRWRREVIRRGEEEVGWMGQDLLKHGALQPASFTPSQGLIRGASIMFRHATPSFTASRSLPKQSLLNESLHLAGAQTVRLLNISVNNLLSTPSCDTEIYW